MFADLDESLRQLLIQRGNLDSGEVDISFDMPTREWAAGISRPTVNLYLYDLRENTELKNPTAWTVRRGPNNTAIKSKPDIRVDVTYNVTAFANAVEDEHRLLSRALLTLLQHPILPAELLQGLVAGQEIPAYTAQPDGIIQSPADYWGALDNDIRPSIDYRLTLRLDLSQEMSVGLALTSRFIVAQINGRNGTAAGEETPLQIGGRVHRNDDPDAAIEGATVTLVERALDATTDALGRFRFAGVPPGAYTMIISAPGVGEQTREIQAPQANYDVGV